MMLSITKGRSAIAATVVLCPLLLLPAAPAVASASPPASSSPSPSTRIYGTPPAGVRVEVSDAGFTVFGTPSCSLAKTCRSWVQVPLSGTDAKDVTTTSGYFVPWPVSWAEGASESGGSIRTFARDVFGSAWTSTPVGLGTITRPITARPLTAELVGQDDAARSASVRGTATPGASIRRDGIEIARAASGSGTWSATVTGLPVGTSDLVVAQYVDGRYRDQAVVRVVVAEPTRPLTAELVDQDDVSRTAVVRGTATPRASIRRGGVEVARAAAGTGAWSATVTGLPAGASDLTFAQYVDGQFRDDATVRVEFRAAALVEGLTGDTVRLGRKDTVVSGTFRALDGVRGPLDAATVTFAAPLGTTLAPSSTSIRGEYRAPGGVWQEFDAVQLVDGALSADRRTATYRWVRAGADEIAANTEFRFGIAVHRSPTSAGSAKLSVAAAGNAAGGMIDARASTPVRWKVATR